MARYTDNEAKAIFAANLKRIMSESDLDAPKLAQMIGLEKQAVYAWLKQKSFPSTSNIQKLIETLHVSSDDLLAKSPNKVYGGFVDVPILGAIAAGTPIEMVETIGTEPVRSDVMARYPNAKLLRVEGESMNRILPNGCYALVDPCNEVIHDGKPYAVCVNGYDATIKRVRKLNNGFQLLPDSNDPTYAPTTYNYNEPQTDPVTIIGEVVYYVLPYDWGF